MSEKLPFEDAFENRLNGVRLPGEDASWEKMNALLNAEEDDRKSVTFWQRYMGLSVAAGLLLLCTVAYFAMENVLQKKPANTKSASEISPKQDDHPVSKNDISSDNNQQEANRKNDDLSTVLNEISKEDQHSKSATANDLIAVGTKQKQSQSFLPTGDHEKGILSKSGNNNLYSVDNSTKTIGYQRRLASTYPEHQNPVNLNSFYAIQAGMLQNVADQYALLQSTKPFAVDSALVVDDEKRQTNLEKKYTVSLGLGLKQQIPLGGQQAGTYDYNGNQNLLLDYIPSIFVRFEKQNKWYAQGEFKYASARMIKEFDYAKQTAVNFATGNIITQTSALKKTYYHQLPVSFNMYIKKNWSAGAGIMFNWLQSTVTQNQTDTSDLFSTLQASSRMVSPVKGFTDSFLTRSHTSVLLQSDYHLNRFSFGLRYSYDLNPFIKYTMPDGTLASKRGYALDIIIRFRIYKSRKF